LFQARVQVAAFVEAGEEVSESAAQQARAVNGVLDADRRHQSQVREEVARQILAETERIAAGEYQHALQLLVAAQRDEREAPRGLQSRHQELVVCLAKGSEPGPLEVGD